MAPTTKPKSKGFDLGKILQTIQKTAQGPGGLAGAATRGLTSFNNTLANGAAQQAARQDASNMAQFQGMLPQYTAPQAYAPAPLASYLKPYNDAQAAAQKQHETALPQIAGAYEQLRKQLAESHAAQQAKLATSAGLAVNEHQQISNQLKQTMGNSVSDLQAQFGGAAPAASVNGVVATNAQQSANLDLTSARQKELMANMQAAYTASNQAQTANSQLAEVGAKTNADSNLQQLLNELGYKKAGAESQYNADLNTANRQNAAEANQAAAQRSQNEMAIYEFQQKQLEKQNLQKIKSVSPYQQQQLENDARLTAFNSVVQPLFGTQPVTAQVFRDIYDKSGGDSAAMRVTLSELAPSLKAKTGGYKTSIDPGYISGLIDKYERNGLDHLSRNATSVQEGNYKPSNPSRAEAPASDTKQKKKKTSNKDQEQQLKNTKKAQDRLRLITSFAKGIRP